MRLLRQGPVWFTVKNSSDIIMMVRQPHKNTGGIQMDINSLLHTKWNCKYHIVFAPKFRRKIAYGQLKQDIANILIMLCKRKER